MIVEEMKGNVLAIVLLAALLRAPGLFTEFWLDEIQALGNVASIDSAPGVFTGIHHDSNHWLMSLWMYAVGQEAPFWLYRLPSFLAGVAAVAAVGWLAGLENTNPGPPMLLAATAFPLVFYSSEARGYSLAVLAGLVLLPCLVRWVESGEGLWLAAYALAAATGVLSHLSFLLVLVAASAYVFVLAGRGTLPARRAFLVPLVPAVVLGTLVIIDLRYLVLGGGTPEPPLTLLARTGSLSVGGPVAGRGVLLFALLAAVVIVAELGRRVLWFWPHRETTDARSYLWIFFAAAALLPLWVSLALYPPFLFPRYFLVSIAFVPLLVASFARSLPRPWPALLLAAWLGANGYSFAGFVEDGRGRYREALRFLLDESAAEVVRVGSDHDLRNGRIVAFYRARMGEEGKRLRYMGSEDRGVGGEFWIVSYEGSRCDGCRLLRAYPSSSLSGARWSLYRTGTR